jgi:hypothetical protein
MDVNITEILELARRAFDSGVKAKSHCNNSTDINSIKEDMILSLLDCIQANEKFAIPPCVGEPFKD